MTLAAIPPHPTNTRRRNRRDHDSRDLLLDAASALLAERKAIDITVADTAMKSRLNSALVRYYFGGKEGLLIGLAERDGTRTIRSLEKLLAKAASAEYKMRAHIAGVINTYYQYPYINRLFHHLLTNYDSEASRRCNDAFAKPILAAQEKIIQQGVEEGTFQPCDAALFYFNLMGACDHIFSAVSSVRDILKADSVTDDLRLKYTRHISDFYIAALKAK